MKSRFYYAVSLSILIAAFEACTVKKAEVSADGKDVAALAEEENFSPGLRANSNSPLPEVLYTPASPKAKSNTATYTRRQLEAAGSTSGQLKKDKSFIAQSAPAEKLADNQSIESYQSIQGRRGCVRYREDDGNTYVTPPANQGSEEYATISENVFHSPRKEPLSTFSIDVDGASYANTRRFLQSGSLPPVHAVRIEEFINTFDYDYPQPTGRDPFSITTELATTPWNAESKLVHIGLQGRQINSEKLPPSNLVFLIDVSGSMMSEDKLPLLKKGLDLLVDQLRPEDRISIVVYAGAAGMVLPPTSGENKEVIRDALARLQAGGSTAGGAGLQLAYQCAQSAKQNFIKNGNNRVILATDGDFNVGVSSDQDLVRMIEEKRTSGVFLSVLGFGTGNYKDAKMEQLADKGNGNYFYIDNINEARKVLVEKMAGTLYTLAKDVKIQVEFNPALVKSYRLIGYENRVLAAQDFNDDKKDAGELGAGANVTALYEIVLAHTVRPDIDPLKYQSSRSHSSWSWLTGGSDDENSIAGEILTVKFRYKDPKGTTSKLITKTLNNNTHEWKNASQTFRFSAAVAGFALVLKNSQYCRDLNLDNVYTMAKGAKGRDLQGHRAEFLSLVETAKRISGDDQTSYPTSFVR